MILFRGGQSFCAWRGKSHLALKKKDRKSYDECVNAFIRGYVQLL